MKTITFSLLLSLFAFMEQIVAQSNKSLVLQGFDRNWSLTDSQQNAVALVTEPGFQLPTKQYYVTLQKPDPNSGKNFWGVSNVYSYVKDSMSWQYLGQARLASLLYNVQAYSFDAGGDDSLALCDYCLLGFGNIGETVEEGFHSISDHRAKKTIQVIYKNHWYHEKIYQWLKPAMIASWHTLSGKSQKMFVGLIDYMINYLQTFDYTKEKVYFEKVKASGNEFGFCRYDRSGHHSPFRKASAWCFRRINNGQMNAAYLLNWCNRIKMEIMT